jgi:hypothetical protein
MSQINRNQLIHKIKDYLPNEKIQFKKHEITGELQIIFTNKKAIMTVLESNTWDEVKRHIDAKMSNEKNGECSICSEIQKRRVTCTKCASDWCVNCYISIFRTNKGIIKCPFCRFAYGEEFPECMVEIGVQQILDSL